MPGMIDEEPKPKRTTLGLTEELTVADWLKLQPQSKTWASTAKALAEICQQETGVRVTPAIMELRRRLLVERPAPTPPPEHHCANEAAVRDLQAKVGALTAAVEALQRGHRAIETDVFFLRSVVADVPTLRAKIEELERNQDVPLLGWKRVAVPHLPPEGPIPGDPEPVQRITIGDATKTA